MFDSTEWDTPELDELQEQDGTVGSGIFDPGSALTVHEDAGVFADNPALPRYIADHPPFRPFEDERGVEMEVPTGGAAYIDIPNQPSVPLVPARGRAPVRPGGTAALLPSSEIARRIPSTPTVDPRVASAPIVAPNPWVARPVISPRVTAPLRGFGAEPAVPSWAPLLIAGGLVGAAVAILHNTVQARRGA